MGMAFTGHQRARHALMGFGKSMLRVFKAKSGTHESQRTCMIEQFRSKR